MPTSALKASRPERSPLPIDTTLKLRSLDTECTITGLLSKEGGSGLVYEATDNYNTTIKGKERNLIIKECCPLARIKVGGSEKSLASLLTRDPKSNELTINEDLEDSWKLEATKVFEDYKQHFKDAFRWHSINAADAKNQTAPLLGFSEENNTVYIISLRQEGMSLKELYGSRVGNFTSALAILISLCELLEFYHEKGYVYLDVKPDNIFCLTKIGRHPSGEISFFDFDTVQLIADLKEGKWSAPRGSIGYAPREQRNTAEVRNISERSDIYSVGATLHWLVTGNKPDAEDDLRSNHESYEWKPKKDLELTFLEKSLIDSIFSNTLQDSYLERYKDMASLIAELKKLRDASKVKILSTNLTHDEEDSYIIKRKKDHRRINKALKETGKYRIWGTPGLGKSELAKDYAKHTFGRAYDTVIFLVVDGSLSTAISSQLQVKRGSIFQENGLDARLELLRGTDERTLIILDNYTEVDPDNELEMKCRNVLFRQGGHHLIVTQRAPSHEKPIKPLGKAKLIKLYFMNRGKDFYCKDEEEFLKSHFLEVIESHTLVLVLVARLLTSSGYTLRQLCDDLSSNLAALDDGPDSEAETTIEHRSRPGTYAIHIARLIDLSSLSADAARLFSLLSMVPAKGADRKLLSQLCTADDFNKAAFNNALSALVKLGLAQVRFIKGNEQEVVLHPLISDIAAGLLEEREVVERYLVRLGNYLHTIDEGIDYSKKAEAVKLGGKALERNTSKGVMIAAIYSLTGSIYIALGEFDEALKCQLEALEICRAALHEGHPNTTALLGNLGITYRELGNFDEALKCNLKALKISEATSPEGHPDIAALLCNTGAAYYSLDNFDEALKYQLNALEIDRSSLPEDHPGIAVQFNNIALTYRDLGNFKEALMCQLEALLIGRAAWPEGHPILAIILGNMGGIYQSLGGIDVASRFKLEALEMHRATLPEGHPDIATSLNSIGVTYRDLDNFDEALKCQLEALEIRKAALPEDHPGIATTLNDIGVTYQDLGDYVNAQEYFDEAKIILGD